MKSPIRWAGSKRALLPILKRYWVDDRSGKYIEPFCGSACLYFDLEPSRAILGDINSELITAYKVLRKSPSKVVELLSAYPINRDYYYELRALKAETLSEIEQTARFLFLNRLCFNGIYRTNLSGQFNVPFGKPKREVQFDFDALAKASTLLKRASLQNSDFALVLDQAQKGDFVYLDPPYAVAKRRVFSQYYPESFAEQDLQRLRACLKKLDRRGVHFVVSYADSREGRELVAGWKCRRVRTRRNVAGFADNRRNAYELMATNQELHE
ncbi:DNA adenine methylase [Bradyrhizobium stylosanthis]|uniref:Site-specific DNA-methyltransferase (adenine-specific) n=1 Tax=Bradyrhizobium stylosanthis TaxID=1803665 RepID=A0A560D544_9BRAD|nr:Dam family site-specific DNA-(adenine-N6)-methyltransferase [Bradyrhizobium stylosanthis]TWA92234.1 DNA adenine methylase [Bradyrhizobium stylosanthis]